MADIVCLCKTNAQATQSQTTLAVRAETLDDIMFGGDVGLFVYIDDLQISLLERFYLFHNER